MDLFLDSAAVISSDGRYRYRLSRHWSEGPEATFIMLNPSTADAEADDPTIRKCVGFAKHWGMGGIFVGNLFAIRATKPADMMSAYDPVGPDNRGHLDWMCERAAKNGGRVICAWGVDGCHMDQDRTFMGWMLMANITPMALRLTKDGHPWHPLYVPYRAEPVPFVGRA